MATASDIIRDFGGCSAVAKALGVGPSTVHAWGQCNHIPAWRQEKLLSLALERGVALSATDFPSKAERIKPGVAA
jgi:hypothetical protein